MSVTTGIYTPNSSSMFVTFCSSSSKKANPVISSFLYAPLYPLANLAVLAMAPYGAKNCVRPLTISLVTVFSSSSRPNSFSALARILLASLYKT